MEKYTHKIQKYEEKIRILEERKKQTSFGGSHTKHMDSVEQP